MQGHDPLAKTSAGLARQLSNLKLVSRLLGHELHSQGSAKTITLSREEVLEIQTTLDLFIEEVARQGGHLGGGGSSAPETRMVGSVRN